MSVHLLKSLSLPIFSYNNNSMKIYPLQTHLHRNPIKRQPREQKKIIFAWWKSSFGSVTTATVLPWVDKSLLWIVRLTAVLYGMTSCNLVYTFSTSFACGTFMPPATKTERFSAAVILNLNTGGWIVSDAGKWGSSSAPQSRRGRRGHRGRGRRRRLGVCDSQVSGVHFDYQTRASSQTGTIWQTAESVAFFIEEKYARL